jgi:hypothetical protein
MMLAVLLAMVAVPALPADVSRLDDTSSFHRNQFVRLHSTPTLAAGAPLLDDTSSFYRSQFARLLVVTQEARAETTKNAHHASPGVAKEAQPTSGHECTCPRSTS